MRIAQGRTHPHKLSNGAGHRRAPRISWSVTVLHAVSLGVAIGALAMVLVTWLGYPSLVWLRTRWYADPLIPVPFGTDAPRVSVVVATRDGAEAIAARLRNLLETDYPADRLEVIIACDPAR